MTKPPTDKLDSTDERETDSEKLSPHKQKSSSSKPRDLSHVPCKFFKVGVCTAGPSCPFSHVVHDSEPGQQKDVCAWFVKGNCKFGHKCALAHVLPGQSMSMDRKNKKAAQLAANSGVPPIPGRDSRTSGSVKEGHKSALQHGNPSTGSGLLSGSTAPTRNILARRPMAMTLKATPSAPAPPVKDTDFPPFVLPDEPDTRIPPSTAEPTFVAKQESDDDELPPSGPPSDAPPTLLHRNPYPSALPLNVPGALRRPVLPPDVADLGPIGSSPRGSLSAHSPISSRNSPQNAGIPSTFHAHTSLLTESRNRLGSTAGVPSSVGHSYTWKADIGSVPTQRIAMSAIDLSITGDRDILSKDEDLEEFLPSSLTDLLTPSERSRRMFRTHSRSSRPVNLNDVPSPLTPISTLAPAPTLLGDARSRGLDCDLPRAAHLQTPDLRPSAQRLTGPVQYPTAPHLVDGATEQMTLGSWTDETDIHYPQQPESVLTRKGSFTGKTIDIPLQWLHDSSYTETHEKLAALHLPGTCSWLYDTDQYAIWWSRNDSFLWLQGKAGSGKSNLAYSVIEHLKKSQDPVMFFYCNHRADSCASAVQVMRSLLYQMLRYVRESPSGMQAAGRSLISDILEQITKGIHNDYQRLPSLVASTAQSLHRPPFVIIDALDECKDVEWLLEALAGWSTWGRMRIFVTSRPLKIIKEKLVDVNPKSVISWDQFQKWASSDITKFISKELDTWEWLGEALLVDSGWKEKITSVLSEKAEGVFLWAKYQLDMLGQCSNISEIQQILNKLPPPVEFFDGVIISSDMQKVGSKFVRRILAWLICALRPVRLCEIVEALMTDVHQRTMEPEQLRQAIKISVSTSISSQLSLELEIGNALLHVLGSLVTHDEETGFLTLLHSGLGTYLTDPATNAQHQIDLQDAHEEITATCMCYLSLCLRGCLISINDEPPFRTISNSDAQQSRLHRTGSPLLDYVLTNSFHHLPFLLPGNEAILGDMSALESDLQQYPDGWKCLRGVASHSHPWPSINHDFMLYTLIAFSPDWLLRVFLDRESLFHHLERYQGTNPLIYAAHFRAVDQAKTLLSRGANLHNYGWLVDDSGQALPLVAAVKGEGKSTAILDLFLEWRSPIPPDLFTDFACNPSSYTPPIIRRLLQTDDFVGWIEHHQGQNLSFYSFLPAGSSLADEEELIAILWRLVQVGLDPHIPDAGGKTVLHLASEKGYISLVEYLVSIGVQLPDSILFSVLERGSLDARTGMIIRYLLREGADANSRFPPVTGDTVLHTAIKNAATPSRSNTQSGLIEVVMALVDSGCDTNSRNPENYTPLHLAIIGGHVPVVKYLFEVTIPLPDDLSSALLLAPPSTQEEIREILARSG